MAHTYTTQKELRAAFWQAHPAADRRMIKNHAGTGRMYCTDTRVAWCDWLAALQKDGAISEGLADRATLQPGRVSYEYEVQGYYGRGPGNHGRFGKGIAWETECTEYTKREALQRLKEYRENGPGEYRIKRRRIITPAAD